MKAICPDAKICTDHACDHREVHEWGASTCGAYRHCPACIVLNEEVEEEVFEEEQGLFDDLCV